MKIVPENPLQPILKYYIEILNKDGETDWGWDVYDSDGDLVAEGTAQSPEQAAYDAVQAREKAKKEQA